MNYQLSENQKRFVHAATRVGYEIDYEYSGRGMIGRVCPAIRVARGEDFYCGAITVRDVMGECVVIYAKY